MEAVRSQLRATHLRLNRTLREVEERANLLTQKWGNTAYKISASYPELSVRANQLPHHLRELGERPDDRVAICLERSLEMMVAILAVAGIGKTLPVIELADPDPAWNSLPDSNPDSHSIELTSKHLAYLIYISGSTGLPKGVIVEHRQLHNYIVSIVNRIDLRQCRSFGLMSTLAADLGNTALFSSLLLWDVLHVLTQESVTNSELFSLYCNKHRVDCIKITPSHSRALLWCEKWILHSRARADIWRRAIIEGVCKCYTFSSSTMQNR